MKYLIALVANLTLGTFNVGFAIAGNNQVGRVLEAQFGWEHDTEAKQWNTVISSTSITGLVVGSFAAGYLLKTGRRSTIMSMNVLACLAVIPTMFLDIRAILVGKFIFGLASGAIIVASSLYLNETVPAEKSSTFAFTTNFGAVLGITICLALGLGLPDASMEPE